jgi:hypothetical protein
MADIASREVSVSPQRLRNLFLRGRPEKQLGTRVEDAFTRAGLRVEAIAVTAAVDVAGYILTASGWHEDGAAFTFTSPAFTGSPVDYALQAAKQIVTSHVKVTELDATPAPAPKPALTVTTPPAVQPPLPAFLLRPKVIAMASTTKAATHKALTFADRLKTISKKIDSDLETGLSTLEQLEQSAAAANAGIASVVAQKTADVGALTDVLNQLTNGDDAEETETEAPKTVPPANEPSLDPDGNPATGETPTETAA